jgi:cytochrome P450
MQGEAGAGAGAPVAAAGTAGTFDVRCIDTKPRLLKAINWLLDYPQREYLLSLARRFLPIVSFKGWVAVFRDEDVREVLAHDEAFAVSWGGKMKDVTGDRNFVLGMKNDDEYRMNYRQLAHAFAREDVPRVVEPKAFAISESILRGKARIDAVRELMWAVPARLCDEYYGIEMADPLLVADWSVAMSSYLFGPPTTIDAVPPAGDPGRKLATQAANGFRDLIRRSIRNTKAGRGRGTVLPRLIDMQKHGFPGLTDEVIEAHLFGMVTGFIPTNLLVGGNILETLLRSREFMQRTRAAALANDDDLLWRCLQEALRFRFFNPGPFRVCAERYTIAAGTRRETTVEPGTRLIVATPSAMFDPRRVKHPHAFDPHRPADDYLVFGYGQHWCLGAYIAIGQLRQTFKALLRKEGLRRAPGRDGRLQYISMYPAHLQVEFDA